MAPEARMPTSLVKFALFPEYRPEVAQPLKEDLPFTLADVKAVIPKECFTANMWLSWYYIARDLTQFAVAAAVAYVALSFIEAPWLRAAVWALYVLAQGSTGFGMWVIGHECGHQAYFGDRRNLNDLVGFLIHSAFLTPYHSWRITHATHHRYTNHTEKDTAFPPKHYPAWWWNIGEYFPLIHAPFVFIYFTVGFPIYLLLNWEGHEYKKEWCSHFLPSSPIFTEKQRNLIWLSDAGFLAMAGFVYLAAQKWGAFNVFMWYGLPVLATFAWLVFVTFLQHADKRAPHYDEEDNFDFLKGALCTVDRNYGLWNNWMHHITDAHVVHHLFSHMPFYHAKTATPYVRKFCGEHYLYDARPLPVQLWESWFVHQSSFLHSKKWKDMQTKKTA